MRLLGVDFGFKRIGLAIGESEVGIVTPRPAIAASGTLARDADTLAAMARREEAEELILGLPVEESGEEGRMARICRQLAGHLRDRGVVVKLVDEGLSSVTAERELMDEGLKASQRRKRRDGEAARIILERYMNGAHAQEA